MPTAKAEHLQAKIKRLKQRHKWLLERKQQLHNSGEDQISLTDPDARAMPASAQVGVGYNAQIAVDAKHHLIAEQEIYNHVSDHGLLTVTASAAKEALDVEDITVLADGGYYQMDDLEACDKAGITTCVPSRKPRSYGNANQFDKANFTYDAKENVYICPAGEKLPRAVTGTRNNRPYVVYGRRSACSRCEIKSLCKPTKGHKRIHRYEAQDTLTRVKDRMAAWPKAMDVRREIVEHPFGSIKHWIGQRDFLTRRLPNVRAAFSLTALAYNMRRAINLVGVESLVNAAKA